MDAAARQALVDYGRTLLRDGWETAEVLVGERVGSFRDFEKWARALAIFLRCRELLDHAGAWRS